MQRALGVRQVRRRSWRTVRLVVVAASVVVGAVVLPGVLPALAASAWADDDRLVVSRLETDPLGDPVAVHLSWPAPEVGVDGFQIVRDGAVVGTAGPFDLGAVDTGVATAGSLSFRYEVRALSGGSAIDVLGPLDVAFPVGAAGCTRVWTGAIDGSWHLAGNWTSVGVGAGEAGAPGVDDIACAPTITNWPITVSQPGAVAKSFTTSRLSGQPTLRVATGGELVLGGSLQAQTLDLAGGSLSIGDDSILYGTAARAAAIFGGGELTLGGVLRGQDLTTGNRTGFITGVADTTTTLSGGRIEVQQLRYTSAIERTLVGRDGHVLDAEVVRFEGTNRLEAGPGGATLLTQSFDVNGAASEADVEWSFGRSREEDDAVVDVDGKARLADLLDVDPGGGDVEWNNADVRLRGELEVDEAIDTLFELELNDPGAALRTGGKPDPFAGLRALESLRVNTGTTVPIDGDLTVRELDVLSGSTLDVAGTIVDPNGDAATTEGPARHRISNGAVRVGAPWIVRRTGTLAVAGATIDGDVAVDGALEVGLIDEASAGAATFTGDVDVRPGATLAAAVAGVDPGTFTEGTVEGQLTLDGGLIVYLWNPLPDEVDLTILPTPTKPTTGELEYVDFQFVDVERFDVDVRDDGVHVVSTGPAAGPGWDVGDALQVAGVEADAGGAPVEVALLWPPANGPPDAYAIDRVVDGTATELDVVDGDTTEWTDGDPVPTAEYVVRALDDLGDEVAALAPARVPFPADTSCTILWTHAAGDDTSGRWSDQRNWAPYGTAGSISLADGYRLPQVDDRACIASGRDDAVLVEVDEPGTSVGSVETDRAVLGVGWTEPVTDVSFSTVGSAGIDRLLVGEGAAVDVGGDLVVDFVNLKDADASLVVDGALEHEDRDPDVAAGAVVTGGTVATGGWSVLADASVELAGAAVVEGPLTLGGTFVVEAGASAQLDELVAKTGSTVQVRVDSTPAAPALTVDQGDLDGDVEVVLAQELAEGTDVLLIATTTPSSTTPTLSLSGPTAGASLAFGPTGIRLQRLAVEPVAWADGDRVEVAGLVVDDFGVPVGVGVRWPVPSGSAEGFEVVRSGPGGAVVVGSVDGSTFEFVDSDPFAQGSYTVRALVGGSVVDGLGPVGVRFPAVVGCSVVWTGAVGSGVWGEAGNWAPIGVAGSVSPLAGERLPDVDDHACIPGGLPVDGRIVSVLAPVEVRRLSAGLDSLVWAEADVTVADGASLGELLVDGADVSVFDDLSTPFVAVVADGHLHVDADLTHPEPSTAPGEPEFRWGANLAAGSASVAGTWTVPDGATLQLDQATLSGVVEVGGRIELPATAAVTAEADLDLLATAELAIEVDDPATPPSLAMFDDLVLGGSLAVDLGTALGEGDEVPLVVPTGAGTITGAFATQTLAGEVTGTSIVADGSGIRLRRPLVEPVAWADGDRVEVAGLVVDDFGVPVGVGVRWPVPSGSAEGFEVVRSGPGGAVVVGSVDGSTFEFVDSDPFAQGSYTVRALVGGSVVDGLGPVGVRFPAVVGCSVVWTGAVGSGVWGEAGNWAPIGVAGSVSPLAGERLPDVDDHACIPGGLPLGEHQITVEAPVDLRRLSAGLDTLLWVEAPLEVSESASLGELLAYETTVAVGGDLSSPFVAVVGGGSVAATGAIDHPAPAVAFGDPRYRWGAVVEDGAVGASGTWSVPVGATVTLEAATVTAAMALDGILEVPAAGGVVLAGDIALGGEAVVDLAVDDPADAPTVTARGTIDLDGTLDVELVQELAEGSDVTVLATDSTGLLSGAFATEKLTGASTGASLAIDDAAIRVVREAGPAPCADVPDVDGLAVDGCWQEGPDDTYTANPDPDDPATMPSIGDVLVSPRDGSVVVLDLGADPATLTSTGPVDVGIDVALPTRVARWTANGPIAWAFGAPVELPTDRFFGVGLAGAPRLTVVDGHWRASFDVALPGLLGGASAPVTGDLGGDGHMANPTGLLTRTSVAEFGRVEGLSLTYADLNRWQLATPTPGAGTVVTGQIALGAAGPTSGSVTLGRFGAGDLADLDGIVLQFSGATQAWTADLDGTAGSRELRLVEDGSGGLGAGSRLDLGPLDLGIRGVPGPIRIAKGSSGWSLPTVPSVGALLQQLDVSFVDGVLEGGRIRLGDLAPGDLTTPTVAEAGGWLPVGGLTIDHDARTDTWIVDGFLDQPRVDVGGTVDLDDGRVAAATFEIDHVDLGAFATFDLRMSYSAGRTFGLTAELVGDALEGRPSGTGTLTFDDAGAITAGSLRFAEIPIGDLLLIDGLQVSWLRSQGRWSASGEVAGTLPGSEPSAITGSLGFDDGVLVAAELTAQHLPLGPSLLDTFVL
ncbi:MAG TPA: hypothetical protein P5254_03310, partial [Aquihabitans sp.]|nr:hypothetical protein [Aquihabitans sp.]